MVLSVLQLNINADNYWDNLIQYLHNNDYDVILLQELAGIETVFGNINCTRDTYLELHKELHNKYTGEFILTDQISSSDTAYFGNAIFFKKQFKLLDKRLIYMHKNSRPFPSSAKGFEKLGRGLLHVKLEIEEKPISFLTTHFAWAKRPQEEAHQTVQGKILLNYLQSIKAPFILTGDFNMANDQPTIRKISELTQNLVDKFTITNSLNLREHRASKFFPNGCCVDYIFISPDLTAKEAVVLEKEDISDHLGISAKIEI